MKPSASASELLFPSLQFDSLTFSPRPTTLVFQPLVRDCRDLGVEDGEAEEGMSGIRLHFTWAYQAKVSRPVHPHGLNLDSGLRYLMQ